MDLELPQLCARFAGLSLCVGGGRRFSPPITVITEGNKTSFPRSINPPDNRSYHSAFNSAPFPIPRFLFTDSYSSILLTWGQRFRSDFSVHFLVSCHSCLLRVSMQANLFQQLTFHQHPLPYISSRKRIYWLHLFFRPLPGKKVTALWF